ASEPLVEGGGVVGLQHGGVEARDAAALEHLDAAAAAGRAAAAIDGARLAAGYSVDVEEAAEHLVARLAELGPRGRRHEEADVLRRLTEAGDPNEVLLAARRIPDDQRLLALDANGAAPADGRAR